MFLSILDKEENRCRLNNYPRLCYQSHGSNPGLSDSSTHHTLYYKPMMKSHIC